MSRSKKPSPKTDKPLHPAMVYAAGVRDGSILACKWVRLAVERHYADLENGHERGLYFDEGAAQHVIDFFGFLRHSKGEWAGAFFVLAPWQQFVLWVLFGWMKRDGLRRFRTAYLEVARKNGKALSLDTPIPCPTGWTSIGDIKLGDIIFNEKGEQCRVVFATEVQYDRRCYEVCFSDGEKIIADAEHIWTTKPRYSGRAQSQKKEDWHKEYFEYTTEQIRDSLSVGSPDKGEWNHKIDLAGPLDLPDLDLPIPPYVLGAWLGDGTSANANLTCSDVDTGVLREIEREGVSVAIRTQNSDRTPSYLLGGAGKRKVRTQESLQSKLRSLQVLGNKHIPTKYLRSSGSQRFALLQGLMDTDGYASKAGQCEFTTISPRLRDDFLDLSRGLGFKPLVKTGKASCRGKLCGVSYRIQFWAYQDRPVFRLKRKADRLKILPEKKTRSFFRQIVAVDPVESVPVRCIQVDSPSSLFLVGRSMVPTHNTTLLAGIGLYLFDADGEPGAEIFSAATKRDQARISHAEATRMVKASPWLRKRIGVFKDNLHVAGTASKFEPLGADSDTMDGLNVHGALIDELHAHKTRGVWDILETATGSRRQSLQFAITTAGTDRHSVCWEQHRYVEQILEGVLQDDSYFGMIYTLDKVRVQRDDGTEAEIDEDYSDESLWIKANPNIDVSVKREDLRRKVHKAQQLPSAENATRRLHFDVWTESITRWLSAMAWNSCGTGVIDIAELKGRDCYAGLDLSSTLDVSALVYVFPPIREEERYKVLCRFFIPEENMDGRGKREKSRFEVWVKQGYVIATPGNVIDYDFISGQIDKDAQLFNIQEIAFDRWGSSHFIQEIQKKSQSEDFLVQFGQGFQSMAAPTKDLERMVLKAQFEHGNNPVLAWMASNVVVRSDPAGNLKPDKEKSTEKIDGIVALIMALDRALKHVQGTSVYESRGVIRL